MKKINCIAYSVERIACSKGISAICYPLNANKKRYPCLSGRQALNAKMALFFIFVCCVLTLTGCDTLKEGARGFLGISTRALEEGRKDALVKTFNYDYDTCYNNTLDALQHMHTYIYKQSTKEHIIAIYVSEQNTTPVGLFFKEIDKSNTQVEVFSLSTYAKEFISGKVFSFLDKKVTVKELEAQADAEKEKGLKFSH